jgi:hypothetical protein
VLVVAIDNDGVGKAKADISTPSFEIFSKGRYKWDAGIKLYKGGFLVAVNVLMNSLLE